MDYNTQKSREETVVGGEPALSGSSGSSVAREERRARGWRGPRFATRAVASHAGSCSSMQFRVLGVGSKILGLTSAGPEPLLAAVKDRYHSQMPIPMAMNVPKVLSLCIMVFLMLPISSRPHIPILRQEKVPKSAPAAMPTEQPITKPIFMQLKQLGWDCSSQSRDAAAVGRLDHKMPN
ncbi:hypothetical protein Celaphus_00001394 [Cervus elaphus hippelaphus]|uniref:Uncharacterized protein n=1 Tax=Cervus elaphus hippelaphus TaxID=46360 RepID=A0A212D7B1_CEREH|nr:hypothetical protein Celaphus_00001394 [Cervus elaphus hippelaphus]